MCLFQVSQMSHVVFSLIKIETTLSTILLPALCLWNRYQTQISNQDSLIHVWLLVLATQ